MASPDLARLFLTHQPMLKAYIRSAIHRPEDAEDLLQEAGVRILTSKNVPLAPDRFGPYVRGLARNLLLNYFRERKTSNRPIEEFLDVLDNAFTSVDPAAEKWARRGSHLQECMKGLSEKNRSLLGMRYVEGARSEIIAQRTGRSIGSVRMALMRMRQVLSECIRKRMFEAGSE